MVLCDVLTQPIGSMKIASGAEYLIPQVASEDSVSSLIYPTVDHTRPLGQFIWSVVDSEHVHYPYITTY